MDDDDYPQFGNAFPAADPSAAAQSASWNPAFRPDNEPAESDDDFFDRYPGATPKKSTAQPGESVDQSDDAAEASRRQSISVQSMVDVRYDAASPDDMDRRPSYMAGAEGPVAHSPPDEADDEEQVLHGDETEAQQEQLLDERIPVADDVEATQPIDEPVAQVDHASADAEGDAARPEEHYEHQGEVTEMEEAVEPSGDAPLLDDEEPLPTPGQVSREPTFGVEQEDAGMDLDGSPAPGQPSAKSRPANAQLDRSFTSNFVNSESESAHAPAPAHFAQSAPDDWPSFGDDQTFGELLDTENPSKPAPGAPAVQPSHASNDDLLDDLLPEDQGEIPEKDLAAAWGAALDDDDMLADPPTDFDPSHAFGGDDEDGFLEDELASPIQQQPSQPAQPASRSLPTNQYRPANAQAPAQQPRASVPVPQPFDTLSRAAGTPSTGLPDFYNQQPEQTPERPPLNQAQSFVDKAKGGYQSPYDLPMEVVKPRRRPQVQPQQSQQPVPAPPPRTSSFGAQMNRPPPSTASGASMSPPTSSHSNAPAPIPSEGTASTKTTPKTGSGFFEDLPIAPKPRARPSGAYTPGPGVQGMPTPPPGPTGPPQQPPVRQQAPPMAPPQRPAAPPTPSQQPQSMYGGLQQPDRMPLLPDQASQPPQPMPAQQGPPSSSRYSPSSQPRDLSAPAPPPAATGRYSPAPATSQAAPTSRYSPAPSSEPGQKSRQSSSTGPAPGPIFRQPSHAFAPRTSSPLAGFTDKPHPPLPSEAPKPLPSSPPRMNGISTSNTGPQEASSTSIYSPSEMRASDPQLMPPPPRPRTQSPDNTMKSQRSTASHARRPSSAGKMQQGPSIPQPGRARGPALPHRRQFSRDLTIVRPDNETAQDPLQRWKGHPIFHWNASGAVVTSFPRQTPFYAAGQTMPSLKCTPGTMKIEDASTFLPLDDRNAKFPGPLTARSKGKKKDLMTWMTAKIEDLERATEGAMLDFSMENEVKKRAEEKLILWKIVRIFLEHDGVLEGNSKVDEELRRILMPNLAQMGQVMELHTPVSAVSAGAGEPVDKQVLFQLRLALFEGQRERAVWLAEEKKLWGHAMLIASTMGPNMWKQIVAAFVRSQVKSLGSDARSMAAAYQIFAGNAEECVDELVPPSARAGFTMIAANRDEEPAGHNRNRSKSFYERNPLDGLDSWRETLSLITSNRTAADGPSLLALGKLLSSYGRVEAAHACFLFARQFVKHSGADDAEAHFVLLGANHAANSQDLALGSDLDSILLTEIFEFASSLSAPGASAAYIPHFQAFKLVHAQELASRGLKSKAQTYCDHITTVYTSTTRPSPYYHPQFTQAVSDLQALLSQVPTTDGKKGLFSKPAMNKVSSSASSWFTKFVAGDDDHQSADQGMEGAQAGPFGMVGASPPTASRPGSAAGMYNPMMGGPVGGGMGLASPMQSPPTQQAGFAPHAGSGKYAPGAPAGGSKYSPAQPYSGLGIPSAEPQRPGSSRYAPAPSSLGVPGVSRASSDYAPSGGSRRGSAQETSSQGSYEPRPMLGVDDASSYSYSPPILQRPEFASMMSQRQDSFSSSNGGLPPAAQQHPPPTSGSDEAVVDPEGGSGYQPPDIQPSSGYEPPGYSYQPYEPEPESPAEDAKPAPKRRTYGDEDDDDADMAARAAALKKSAADREADEAFRKAAEADAARDNNNNKSADKKGWFGGWFGGKGKDPNAMPAGPGPIKAKLGEENSFYFDKELGKWVNKKAGAEAATPVAATPPPPKGPASRVASGGPPSGPPSRASSGTGLSGLQRPPTSGSGPAFSVAGGSSAPPSRSGTPASEGLMPPPPLPLNGLSAGGSGEAPPSRPSTSLSNASSIDDLLASGSGGKKGGTVKGKKKGRYVDVMAK